MHTRLMSTKRTVPHATITYLVGMHLEVHCNWTLLHSKIGPKMQLGKSWNALKGKNVHSLYGWHSLKGTWDLIPHRITLHVIAICNLFLVILCYYCGAPFFEVLFFPTSFFTIVPKWTWNAFTPIFSVLITLQCIGIVHSFSE
jgi:hypothetical protein